MFGIAALLGAFLLCSGAAAVAQEDEEVEEETNWTVYRADEYGFEMLAPEGAEFEENEWEGGWAGLQAHYDILEFNALARLGVEAKAEDIENYGVEITGIAAENWKKIDEGKNANGWKWYRVYRVAEEDRVIYAGLGVGPQGSYLIFLETTAEDAEEYEADYVQWYKSLKVFDKEEEDEE